MNPIKIILLFLVIPFQVLFAEETINLTLKEGGHQFSFFKNITPVWSYNNQIPGPIIKVQQGEKVKIKVNNNLREGTSVHWHGLRIENKMDGVPGVTQDLIQPGEEFIYQLDVQEPGTYWYHPHFNSSEQLERGLKGALIVQEQKPLNWSKDIVWLIDDWRFQKDGTIFPHFNSGHDLMHDGRWGNVITVNGKYQPELIVAPGERIRLRLINGANARVFANSFKGINAKVIAVDGRPVTKIFSFKDFILSPGNRVDLDIVIPVDATGKTFILEDQFTQNENTLGKIVVADTMPVETPDFEPITSKSFIPASMFNELEISKTWDLNIIRGGKFGIGWSMNQQLWPNSDNANFKIRQPIKLEFKNTSNRLHPMHIHGVFFRVLSINGKPKTESFTRDTVLVGPGESIVIGLVPDHEGTWMTHCHILSHADSGMMTTIDIK